MRLVEWLLAVLAMACVTRPAVALGEQTARVREVDVVVRDPWPESLHKGHLPFLVELENQANDRRTLELEFKSHGMGRSMVASTNVELEPGERRELELFAAAQAHFNGQYMLSVRCAGQRQWISNLGVKKPIDPSLRNVIWIRDTPAGAGEPERIAALIGDERRPRFTASADAPPAMPHISVHGGLVTVPLAGPTTAATVAELATLTTVLTSDLPRRSEPYTSLDAIVVDAAAANLTAEQLETLVTAARLGGRLAFFGPGAQKLARQAASEWIEARFSASSPSVTRTYVCGQGLILVDEEPFASAAQVSELNSAIEAESGWAPAVEGQQGVLSSRGADLALGLRGLDLPYRALTLLLVLFALVVGPLNFLAVKRLKKPALLLVTVPAISLVFSLGLFAYGAIAQGLDVRAVSNSFTLLDQRTHHATSAETRLVFAGSSQGDGLVPGPGAMCLAEPGSGSWNEGRDMTLEFGSSVVYGGDWMPTRMASRQTILCDRAARARVEFEREGAAWVAQNGLGEPIQQIVLRAPDGSWFQSTDVIAPGASGELKPLALVTNPWFERALVSFDKSWLPRASYAVQLERSPFLDDCGIDAEDAGSRHVVVGILEPNVGEAR